jgi:hypothetical protein
VCSFVVVMIVVICGYGGVLVVVCMRLLLCQDCYSLKVSGWVGAVVVLVAVVGASRVRQGRDTALSLWVYGLLSGGVPGVQMVIRGA